MLSTYINILESLDFDPEIHSGAVVDFSNICSPRIKNEVKSSFLNSIRKSMANFWLAIGKHKEVKVWLQNDKLIHKRVK